MGRVSITYREVREWPGKASAYPVNAPFKMTTTRMWEGLERELTKLSVYQCTISGYFQHRDFRRDGGLYADARPTKPGIILEYTRRDQRYRFACDKFKQWLDNLDAIVRSLEALRMMDRYGVMAGQQYEGFKALPEKSSAHEGTTVLDAAQLLANVGGNGVSPGDIMSNPIVARDAFRRARMNAHPDRGGQQHVFVAVTAAGAALRGYFGEAIDA